jgi:EAL domain-containing protein (putative c-di-GMP-specific phosphodiesterase class I)
MAAGFASNVYALMQGAQIDPHLLTLDLDEDAFVKDGKRAAIVLQDLKEIGVTLALDNFGTGYSSLIYLRQFPIDVVKIDRSIVADLAHNPTSRIVVDAVVRLATVSG